MAEREHYQKLGFLQKYFYMSRDPLVIFLFDASMCVECITPSMHFHLEICAQTCGLDTLYPLVHQHVHNLAMMNNATDTQYYLWDLNRPKLYLRNTA